MRSAFFIIVIGLGLNACGPKHHAREVRQDSLASQLNARGVPNESWAEADLSAYELDLIRLERVDAGQNAALIQARRNALDDARAKKLGQAMSATKKASAHTDAAALIQEREALVRDVNADGKPDNTWTTARLKGLKNKLANIDDLGRRIQDKIGRCVVDYDQFTKTVRQLLNKVLEGRYGEVSPLKKITGSHLN